MKTKYEHLYFKDWSLGKPEQKDLTYSCYFNSGILIGRVERFTPLKEFRFFGCNDASISLIELKELLDFIKQVNEEFFGI